jgi:hypothetical protein
MLGDRTSSNIVGPANFDGDGRTDLAWENLPTADRTTCLMNNATSLSAPYLAFVDTAWSIEP